MLSGCVFMCGFCSLLNPVYIMLASVSERDNSNGGLPEHSHSAKKNGIQNFIKKLVDFGINSV